MDTKKVFISYSRKNDQDIFEFRSHEKNREFEILKLIAKGDTTNNIASNLSISPKTVSTYRSRILEKLNLKTNSDLIHYVIDNNLNN